MHEGPEQNHCSSTKNMDFVPVKSYKMPGNLIFTCSVTSVSPYTQLSASLHLCFASSLPYLLHIPVAFLSAQLQGQAAALDPDAGISSLWVCLLPAKGGKVFLPSKFCCGMPTNCMPQCSHMRETSFMT